MSLNFQKVLNEMIDGPFLGHSGYSQATIHKALAAKIVKTISRYGL
jgi:hypothetical protein